jgi:hypothetical protein
MEVHSHTHTASLPDGKAGKKWTHYFWEFLMLFLAVFCGFLAENFREHQVERHREKEYMASLYQDLKTDTINLSGLLKNKMNEVANYDSVFDIFRSKKYLHSGGLRLIRSRAVVDSIQSYKLAVSYLKSIQNFESEHFMLARGLMGKIYDANVFDLMIGDGSNALQRPDKNYPLMPFTEAELNDFHVPMNFIKRNKLTQIDLIKGLLRKASGLMKLLEEKYNIDQ